MNSDGNFEWITEISIQEILARGKMTAQDIVETNYKEYRTQEWLKIFPTKRDIDQAIRKNLKVKLKIAHLQELDL